MRIDLVGGLGCGKSTFAAAFEELGCEVVAEDLSKNPFLEKCYDHYSDYKFPSQLWFVLTKWEELLANKNNSEVQVYDQSLLNTRAYIDMFLHDPVEKELMVRFMDHIEEKMGKPDMVIHMKCSPEEQLRRIKRRGRDMESGVNLYFVEHLQDRIDRVLSGYHHHTLDVDDLPVSDYKHVADNILTYGISYFEMKPITMGVR